MDWIVGYRYVLKFMKFLKRRCPSSLRKTSRVTFFDDVVRTHLKKHGVCYKKSHNILDQEDAFASCKKSNVYVRPLYEKCKLDKVLKIWCTKDLSSLTTFNLNQPSMTSKLKEVASTLHMPDILETNQGALLKFDVKSDRTEPQMNVEFSDGHKLILKTSHLSHLEILDYFYEFVDEKDPKRFEGPEIVTKSSKVGAKRKGVKK
ncbi:hypothetical protein Btru_072444 [Bulinus truncatus]|nr:hypothetical protein Btru_072444 [Bulinus truncatus]